MIIRDVFLLPLLRQHMNGEDLQMHHCLKFNFGRRYIMNLKIRII